MKFFINIFLLVICGVLPIIPYGYAKSNPSSTFKYTVKTTDETHWVDSTLATMSLERKIGQLMMVPVFGTENAGQDIEVQNLVQNYHIGGLIFMKGEPSIQASQANRYQGYAYEVPLMIAQDAEWGVNMRLPAATRFPHNLTLGAIRNDSLIYKLGAEIARQCKTVGVQVNFAPVIDINSNPRNPVIGDRSFGENKYNVVNKGWMYSKGMMDNQILPCVKHFPGHGDTDKDSHKELPSILHSKERLDTLELYPFRQLVEYGIPSMMVAHLNIPALDPTVNRPSTLSPKIIRDLLRNQMQYDGLVFTDALNMEGVAKYYPSGEAELQALKAGNDVLLYSLDVPKAISRIKTAVNSKELPIEDLETAVKRILRTKYRLNLSKRSYVNLGYTLETLNNSSAKILKKELYEAAVTLPKNENNLIPLGSLESLNIAYVQVGGKQGNTFGRTLQKYAGMKTFYLPQFPSQTQVDKVMASLKSCNTVIVGVFDISKKAQDNFGISAFTSDFCSKLASTPNKKTILSIFGTPYALRYFGKEQAILVGYEEETEAQQALAEAIFGGIIVDGKLPVSASSQFREGMGEIIPVVTRFGFGIPEEVKMSSYVLNKFDSLSKSAIQQKLIPGFAVAVLRGNKIVYEKGFGKMDYSAAADSIDPLTTMYDLASVTKIAATTTIAMQLHNYGMLDLNKTVGEYLPEFQNTNKSYIQVKDLLQHTAGLKAWIPFYLNTFTDKSKTQLRKDIYTRTYNSEYTIEVAPGLFLRNDYRDTLMQIIKDSEMGPRGKLVYSDLSMILMGKIIESIVGTSLDEYACTQFYQPMGMSNTCFNPGKKGLSEFCPPTEIDDQWRKCVVKGYVHDPASAMFGGVSGHAGLFSNVYDVCKLLYMIKNGGEYGRRMFLDAATIKQFSEKQLSYSRRGLGFDKPNSDPERSGQVSAYASDEAFGHLGFTGISVWIDPKYDLIFIFLSNRTYPDALSKGFNRKHIRREAMDLVYESMMKKNIL
ncbi:MAG: serine hydrolase [Bacteroidia bacterium]|nr:serine hydrolase [Bacteroidia bacterium]